MAIIPRGKYFIGSFLIPNQAIGSSRLVQSELQQFCRISDLYFSDLPGDSRYCKALYICHWAISPSQKRIHSWARFLSQSKCLDFYQLETRGLRFKGLGYVQENLWSLLEWQMPHKRLLFKSCGKSEKLFVIRYEDLIFKRSGSSKRLYWTQPDN